MELRRALHATLSGNNNDTSRQSPQSRKSGNNSTKIVSSNPYDHLPSIEEKKEDDEQLSDSGCWQEDTNDPEPKMPSGSVGAYSRAVRQAANAVTALTKERRKARFRALPEDEQRQLSLTFLDACSSDENLPLVKDMIHTMDIDSFFIGSDGSETCALHTASFHGAAKVLDFLCRGIDYGDYRSDVESTAESSKRKRLSMPNDGGLADINLRDSNGWTGLHFAAGANAIAAAEVLASHGAELAVEANNGYTPLLWAQRLSNDEMAETLKGLQAKADQKAWMSSRGPLSQIAHRFFSFIPSAH